MLKKLFGFGKKNNDSENQKNELLDENSNFTEGYLEVHSEKDNEIIVKDEEHDQSETKEKDNVDNFEKSEHEESLSEVNDQPVQTNVKHNDWSLEKVDIEDTLLIEDPVEVDASLESVEDVFIEAEEKGNEENLSQNIGFFARLKQGLSKTSKNFSKKIDDLFSGYTKIEDSIFDELEELLILGDLGFETAMEISNELRKRASDKKIEDVQVLEQELQNIIEEILVSEEAFQAAEYPQIMVVVGVNGVGKTTSIGKISLQLKREGKSVMLVAGDTFRAAAADQLSIWAQRTEVPIVRSNEGADPSSVIFDGIKSAQSKGIDVLICDTAGRLHNKKNLMLELDKIFRIINREYPEAQKEVLLVIDATTGQNAISQAKTFQEVAPLSGIILTKLDGTAKGGVVIGLSRELNIPIKYVGVGEKIEDLQKFNPKEFAKALFQKN